MKKQVKWILTALALVGVLAGAVLLYRNLSERYSPLDATTAATWAPETTEATETSGVSVNETVTVGNAVPEQTDAPEKTEAPKEQAKDFIVYDENNAEVRLSDHFGKPLVVNFWASWCGPCRSELPAFDAAAKQYANNVDFMMVNLTDGFSETVSSVQRFVAENGYTFPVYFDMRDDAANTYSVYSIPLTLFIRADGTILDSHIGSMDATTLQRYIALLTA